MAEMRTRGYVVLFRSMVLTLRTLVQNMRLGMSCCQTEQYRRSDAVKNVFSATRTVTVQERLVESTDLDAKLCKTPEDKCFAVEGLN